MPFANYDKTYKFVLISLSLSLYFSFCLSHVVTNNTQRTGSNREQHLYCTARARGAGPDRDRRPPADGYAIVNVKHLRQEKPHTQHHSILSLADALIINIYVQQSAAYSAAHASMSDVDVASIFDRYNIILAMGKGALLWFGSHRMYLSSFFFTYYIQFYYNYCVHISVRT